MPWRCWPRSIPKRLEGKAADAYALLALVAGQDVEPAEDSDGTDGRWRIARKVAPDRMISTVDPDARHAHKTQSRQQDGYKAHIVIEPDTGLITAAELTKASGPENSDGTVGVRLSGPGSNDQRDRHPSPGRLGLRRRGICSPPSRPPGFFR
jgi:hypothetical protein